MSFDRDKGIKELKTLPHIGDKVASCFWRVGIHKVADLKHRNHEELYNLYNQLIGKQSNRALLYIFRCAVYVANTPLENQDPEKLKWFYWNDKKNKESLKYFKNQI